MSKFQRETAMEFRGLLPNLSKIEQSSTQVQATSADRLHIPHEWQFTPQSRILAWLATIESEIDTRYPTMFNMPLLQPVQPLIKMHLPPNATRQVPLLGSELKPRVIRSVSINIPTQPAFTTKETTFSLAIKPTLWLNLLEDEAKHPSSVQIYIQTSIEKIAFECGSLGLLQTIVWANLYKHDIEQTGFWEIVETEALGRLSKDTDYVMRVHGHTESFKNKLADLHFKEYVFYVGIFGGDFLWMKYEEAREWNLSVLKQFT